MASEQTQRRLAAILSADVVGYSRLMAEDEDATVRRLTGYREEIAVLIRQHRGRVVDAPGDNLLAEFPTATDAVEAATEIQRVIRARNAGVPEGRRMEFRIGVHLGEARAEGDRLYGDAVNVAARLEGLAEPGGLCISDDVLHQVQRKLELEFEDLGDQDVKNIPNPVHVYRVREASASSVKVALAPRRVPRRAIAIGAAALVAAGAAAYLVLGGRAPTEVGAPLTSIAVLPFDDMSPGGGQSWLADGMAEELIEILSRAEALRVPARTSTFALRGKDIATVGAQLGVGSVVEGSVRRSEDQLRVTAQLIRVSDGYHLWSARYDRKLADVFAVQSEIARAIAEAIRGELGIEIGYTWERIHEPSDVRAYELKKKGFEARWGSGMPTEAGIRKAIEYYEQALAIDPEYAQAHAELGLSYWELWDLYGRADADFAKARAQAERALVSDATNGSAHELFSLLLYRQYEWEEARRIVDRGIASNPVYGAIHFPSAVLLAHHGRTAEAVVEMRIAADRDPGFWAWHLFLGAFQVFDGEYDAAVESLERAWDAAPGAPLTRPWLAYAHHRAGRDDQALAALARDLPPDLSDLEAAIRKGFGKAGFTGAVRARYEWLVAKSGEPCSSEFFLLDSAGALAILGEADAMFECLDKAIDRRDLVFLKADPVYDPYRSEPRFADLLRRMNLAD